MSDTPRTDALVETAESGLQDFGDTFRSAIDLCRSLERELAQAVNGFSDGAMREERLERIAKLALDDVRTHSRDVDDYLETLEYIAGIARGLKETK